MSHGDQLSEIPAEFHIIGQTQSAPYAAIAHNDKPFYGIQFHPEVTHSPRGKEIIGRFILNICGCRNHWTMVSTDRCFPSSFWLTVDVGRLHWQRDRENS